MTTHLHSPDDIDTAPTCTVKNCTDPAPGMAQLCTLHARYLDHYGRTPSEGAFSEDNPGTWAPLNLPVGYEWVKRETSQGTDWLRGPGYRNITAAWQARPVKAQPSECEHDNVEHHTHGERYGDVTTTTCQDCGWSEVG